MIIAILIVLCILLLSALIIICLFSKKMTQLYFDLQDHVVECFNVVETRYQMLADALKIPVASDDLTTREYIRHMKEARDSLKDIIEKFEFKNEETASDTEDEENN